MNHQFPPEVSELLYKMYAALGEYRQQTILVGGLVPFVYRHHKDYDKGLPVHPMSTKDIDIVIPLPTKVYDGITLAQKLKNSGLKLEMGRGINENESFTRFYLPNRSDANDPYIEFLVRTPGRNSKIKGKPQEDLRAQTCDFADLLTNNSWTISVPEIGDVFVPHPTGYIAQKTRLSRERPERKRMKDQGDVVLVVWAFHSKWHEMADIWKSFMQNGDPYCVWLKDCMKYLERFYSTPDTEIIAGVTEIYNQTNNIQISRQAIYQIMNEFILCLKKA